MTWTKCEDELPEPYTDVMAYRDGERWIATIDDDGFWWTNDHTLISRSSAPTHWRDMPEPPHD